MSWVIYHTCTCSCCKTLHPSSPYSQTLIQLSLVINWQQLPESHNPKLLLGTAKGGKGTKGRQVTVGEDRNGGKEQTKSHLSHTIFLMQYGACSQASPLCREQTYGPFIMQHNTRPLQRKKFARTKSALPMLLFLASSFL